MGAPTGPALGAVQAVRALSDTGTVVHARLGGAWSGVQAIVNVQGPLELVVPGLAGCHFVELCLSGRMPARIEIDGHSTTPECVYRPGALCYLPPGRAGRATALEGRTENLQLVVDGRVMDAVRAEVLTGDPDASDLLGFSAVHDPRMRACAESLHRELVEPSAGGALVAEAMVQALCVEIVRGHCTGAPSTRRPAKAALSRTQLGRALDAIEGPTDAVRPRPRATAGSRPR